VLSLILVLEWRADDQPDAVAAAGIRPGDVVPVIARNQAGWVTAALGLIRAGALPGSTGGWPCPR